MRPRCVRSHGLSQGQLSDQLDKAVTDLLGECGPNARAPPPCTHASERRPSIASCALAAADRAFSLCVHAQSGSLRSSTWAPTTPLSSRACSGACSGQPPPTAAPVLLTVRAGLTEWVWWAGAGG